MGIYFNFLCESCGYCAEQINGGYQCGESAGLHTFSCDECRSLFDATVTRAPWNVKRDPITNRPDVSGFDAVSCPKDPDHTVHLWAYPEGRCPKCGATMTRHDTGACWD
jgi:hypothetical protein